jgi:hypothetical protein
VALLLTTPLLPVEMDMQAQRESLQDLQPNAPAFLQLLPASHDQSGTEETEVGNYLLASYITSGM